MKSQSFILAGLLLLGACNPSAKTEETTQKAEQTANNSSEKTPESRTVNNKTNPSETAEMKFEQVEYNFGFVKEGAKVKHTFKFKNTGSVPLIIQNATASCGCTASDWPKQPISAGETSEIKVEFNSEGKSGNINKTVTILANTNPAQTELRIVGVVEAVSKMNGPVKQ